MLITIPRMKSYSSFYTEKQSQQSPVPSSDWLGWKRIKTVPETPSPGFLGNELSDVVLGKVTSRYPLRIS